jgi:hypothetical protein
MRYTVRSVELNECPVSYIGSEAPALIRDIDRAQTVHKAYGAPILTVPFLEWPGRLSEILELIEHERILEHNARIEAEIREAKTNGR